MSEDKTSEQVLAQHLEDMGPELGAVYNALYRDLTWLHMRWRMFRQLFGTSPERIEVLNETAPGFFNPLQMTLLEDVVLELARMTDPPASAGRDNLSLRRLPELIDDPDLLLQVQSRLDDANSACLFSRDWRNRRLAHRDLDLALGAAVSPLPPVSRASIEAALKACRDLLNLLELHYRNGTIGYEHSFMSSGDADSLVYFLEKGLAAAKEEREILRRRAGGEV